MIIHLIFLIPLPSVLTTSLLQLLRPKTWSSLLQIFYKPCPNLSINLLALLSKFIQNKITSLPLQCHFYCLVLSTIIILCWVLQHPLKCSLSFDSYHSSQNNLYSTMTYMVYHSYYLSNLIVYLFLPDSFLPNCTHLLNVPHIGQANSHCEHSQ